MTRDELADTYARSPDAPGCCNCLSDNVEAFKAGFDARDEEVKTLFDAIKHGDESHQAWLKDAIEKHFALKDTVRDGA